MSIVITCLLVALCSLVPVLGESQTLVQTGRYTAVAAVPTEAQRAPLQRIVTVHFPNTDTTVGDALRATLSGTGYALTKNVFGDADVVGLLNEPLPDVQRTLGPITVVDVLKTLIGPSFRLVIDPVHRLVGLELVPEARSLGFGAAHAKEKGTQ